MVLNVCTAGSDRAFDEVQSWPVGMAVSYFTLAYLTREPKFTILFGYFWESFELFLLLLSRKLTGEGFAWFTKGGALAWLVPPSFDGAARPCVESPVTSLIADPAIFVSAVALWWVGVERVAGVTYDEQRAFGFGWRRALGYAGLAFSVVFASRVMLRKNARVAADPLFGDRIHDGVEPDLGLIMGTLVYVLLTFFVPLRSAQRNGFSSYEARRAMLAYIVYVLFVTFIALFGVLGGPLTNMHSSWTRTMAALVVLWFAVVLAGAVRFGNNLQRLTSGLLTFFTHETPETKRIL